VPTRHWTFLRASAALSVRYKCCSNECSISVPTRSFSVLRPWLPRDGCHDHLVGLVGHVVEEPADPFAGPAGRRQRRELGELSRVVVDVAAQEVAAKPDDHPANVGQPPLVIEHQPQSLAQFCDPLVGHLKRVVIEAVDRRRVDPLLDVPIGEQHDHRGLMPLGLPWLLAWPVRGDPTQACHRVGTGPLGVYASQGGLVLGAQAGGLGAEPGELGIAVELLLPCGSVTHRRRQAFRTRWRSFIHARTP